MLLPTCAELATRLLIRSGANWIRLQRLQPQPTKLLPIQVQTVCTYCMAATLQANRDSFLPVKGQVANH